MPDADAVPDFDAYVHAEVVLPNDEGILQLASVLGQSTSIDGNPIGEYDDNPMLNTRVYDVMFPDGIVHWYSANIIAQNIYESSDDDGFRYQLMEEIIDHRKFNDAVPKEEGYITSKNGKKKKRITTKGWEI